MINPAQFVSEVLTEGRKVVTPSRRETMLTTAMVLVMATVCAIFFFLVDMVLRWAVNLTLGL